MSLRLTEKGVVAKKAQMMKTIHKIRFDNSKDMADIPTESIEMMVTSPPYPMIQMWDEMFIRENRAIDTCLKQKQGMDAFEMMHGVLDHVWEEVFRVLKKGSIACINIGDATRTLGGNFTLYPNHTRILTRMISLGFTPLPSILWRKQTNAPNKFMGSGMMPPGAYVTLEHEYILILRKGGKRKFFTPSEKNNRRESTFFWEERNLWYSDIWMDLKGTTQKMQDAAARKRSAAYPFELPYRLINMFSVKDDTVLDPFFGTGTTMAAAMTACRNSIGYEIKDAFNNVVLSRLPDLIDFANGQIEKRLQAHLEFVKYRFREKGPFKYTNSHYGFPVVTNQELNLLLNALISINNSGENVFDVTYSNDPQEEFIENRESHIIKGMPRKKRWNKPVQLKLLD